MFRVLCIVFYLLWQAKFMKKKNAVRSVDRTHDPEPLASWTFLTNHTHVLWCIYRNPEVRLREVAQLIGITERMVQKIVADLAEAGYLTVDKQGRCNVYEVDSKQMLRHPLESHCSIGQLLELLRKTHS